MDSDWLFSHKSIFFSVTFTLLDDGAKMTPKRRSVFFAYFYSQLITYSCKIKMVPIQSPAFLFKCLIRNSYPFCFSGSCFDIKLRF